MKKFVSLLPLAVLLVAMAAPPTFAESLPSSKAAVALGDLIDVAALANAAAGGALSDSDDTGCVTVMQMFIKTPNDKELSVDVSQQCGLVTDTTVRRSVVQFRPANFAANSCSRSQ